MGGVLVTHTITFTYSGAEQTFTVPSSVGITAKAGTKLTATATVSPTDPTPGDNTSTDKVTIQK